MLLTLDSQVEKSILRHYASVYFSTINFLSPIYENKAKQHTDFLGTWIYLIFVSCIWLVFFLFVCWFFSKETEGTGEIDGPH